ncbi:MAG TPA: hypothetical protein VEJ63_21625 [Planctomycetota bacterium]|nr:hypothetical protein [Planctomycetota bacterium]
MKAWTLSRGLRTGLAVLFVAWLSMRSAQGLPRPEPATFDPIEHWLGVFRRAAVHLPEHGKIGYITESTDTMPFSLAHHALAPRIVVHNETSGFVLTYYPDSEPTPEKIRGLLFVADAGSGVRIYRRPQE